MGLSTSTYTLKYIVFTTIVLVSRNPPQLTINWHGGHLSSKTNLALTGLHLISPIDEKAQHKIRETTNIPTNERLLGYVQNHYGTMMSYTWYVRT